MVAGQLWLMTKEAGYLRDLHRILFTGLRHNQYANGGFGTTSCLGSRRRQDDSVDHSPQAVLRRGEEATWCCSMRGASALAFAAQMSWCTDGERLIAPIAIPGTATVQLNQGLLVLRQTTDYPYEGRVRIEVLRSEVNAPVPLAFFLPDADGSGDCHLRCDGKELAWTWRDGFVEAMVPLRAGAILDLEFALQPRIEALEVPERLPGHVRLMHGPLMLGCADHDRTEPGPPSTWTYQGGGTYRTASGLTLAPLGMRSYRDQEDSLRRPTRFLFQDPAGGRA
jgi:DUF1680 family protein